MNKLFIVLFYLCVAHPRFTAVLMKLIAIVMIPRFIVARGRAVWKDFRRDLPRDWLGYAFKWVCDRIGISQWWDT